MGVPARRFQIELIERCIVRGADSFVPKPLQLGVVKAIWQYCLMKAPQEFNRIMGRTEGVLPDEPRGGAALPREVRGAV